MPSSTTTRIESGFPTILDDIFSQVVRYSQAEFAKSDKKNEEKPRMYFGFASISMWNSLFYTAISVLVLKTTYITDEEVNYFKKYDEEINLYASHP